MTNILKNHIKESDDERLDIEQTANSDDSMVTIGHLIDQSGWIVVYIKINSEDGSGTQLDFFLANIYRV